MRKIILTVLATSLIAASTVQMAAATERHHGRISNRSVMSEQVQNSNAYAEPTYVQPDASGLAEGAMTSGIAGR
jgi:hypothetical protein